jgi:hypothetical protein
LDNFFDGILLEAVYHEGVGNGFEVVLNDKFAIHKNFPGGVCSQELADKIQKVERLAPRASRIVDS